MEDAMNIAQEFDAAPQGPFLIKRRFRYWEVVDPAGELVCLTVYKRGAVEVVRRLYN
jgi:hypothetical protein